jgi:hypothetical protein
MLPVKITPKPGLTLIFCPKTLISSSGLASIKAFKPPKRAGGI